MNCTHPRRDLAPAFGKCAGCAARDIGVCSVVPSAALGRLALSGINKTYPAGSVVVLQGDDARSVYSLQSGVVMLSKAAVDGRRQVLAFRFGGDFIGISQTAEYPFTVKAVTTVRACKFSNDVFDRFMEEAPMLEHELLARAADEVAESQMHATLLGQKTAAERVASFLLWLSAQESARTGCGDTIFMPMTRADIADYLGLTTETVSRGITALKTSGVIRLMAHNAVRILERQALENIAVVD